MATIGIKIDVPEPLIADLMGRRKCSRKSAIKKLRMAWLLEIELMEPVFCNDGTGPDPHEIGFESGGSKVW